MQHPICAGFFGIPGKFYALDDVAMRMDRACANGNMQITTSGNAKKYIRHVLPVRPCFAITPRAVSLSIVNAFRLSGLNDKRQIADAAANAAANAHVQ